MKKLLKGLVAGIVMLAATFAYADFTVSAPKYVVTYADGTDVPDVSRSNSLQKAMQKIQSLPRGVEYSVRIDAFKMTVEEDVVVVEPPPVDPVACGEGFTGFEPNCVPVVIDPPPLVCAAPLVDVGGTCVTTIASCQAIGFDRPNGSLDACINDPEPEVCPDGQMGTPPHCHTMGDNPNDGSMGMPIVDPSFNMTPVTGTNQLLIVPAEEQYEASFDDGHPIGAVRFPCKTSHMSNNDPIVKPGQEGKNHHHTFFGNTSANHASDLDNMANVGNSTCAGGTANRSAYWVPSMIDTSTNRPIEPLEIGLYYKTESPEYVDRLPPGLRMIAKPHLQGGSTRFQCTTPDGGEDLNWKNDEIPSCSNGQRMKYSLSFPTCWDGVNLDSPNHTDHVIYNETWRGDCPASHPHMLPVITFNVFYRVGAEGTGSWRLSSDSTGETSGYSIHGDWVNGWNETIANTFVDECLKKGNDGRGFLLCNGKALGAPVGN